MLAHPKLSPLSAEFLASFARFDYAMKAAGFAEAGPDKSLVPSWPKIAAKYPDLASSAKLNDLHFTMEISYLITSPPGFYRLGDDGKLHIADARGCNSMEDLWNAAHRVRANLLHGDLSIQDATRETRLIDGALAFLDLLLAEVSELEAPFKQGL